MSPLGLILLTLVVLAIIVGGRAGEVPVSGIAFGCACVIFVVLLFLIGSGRV